MKGPADSRDEEVVSLCFQDDPAQVFEELFAQNYSDIAAYCARRLPPDQAADATSEVFAVAWERFADVPAGAAARLWLFGVARNKVEHQRRRTRSRLRLVGRLRSQPTPAVVDIDRATELAEVVAAASRLAPQDLELLRLVAWEGLSHAEVGEVLDLTTNAVGIRLHRIRKKLTEDMKDPEQSAEVGDRTADVHHSKEES